MQGASRRPWLIQPGASHCRSPLAVLAQRRVPLRGLHPESASPQARK